MFEGVKEGVGELKSLGKYLFIPGDVTGVVLLVTGELPSYLITAAYKSIETLKYTLNNNPGTSTPLYSTLLKNLPDIALLTWMAASVIWTGYKLCK